MKEVLVVFSKAFNKLLLIIFLVFAIGCSKKEAASRKHVDITSPVSTATIDQDSENENVKTLEILLKAHDYNKALELIFDLSKAKDLDFIGSKILLDNFQVIMDRAFNDANEERLLNLANNICTQGFANCIISYLASLDNRILSSLIDRYDELNQQEAFLNFILSSNYIGDDKWELLVSVIKESSDERRVYLEIFETVLEQNPQIFKNLPGVDSLILRFYPKQTASWYDYIKKLRSLDVLSDTLLSTLIVKGNTEQNLRLCSLYEIKDLTVEAYVHFECVAKESTDKTLLIQDLMLGDFPVEILREDQLDLKEVTDFFLYRGFSLAEKSLTAFHNYVEHEINEDRANDKFIFNTQNYVKAHFKSDWAVFFEDIKKAAELLAIHGDVVLMRDLERQYRHFFRTVFELPLNLIFASRIMEMGHKETIDVRGLTVVIDSKTLSKELFSGRMDQMISFYDYSDRQSMLIDPLKVSWAFRAIKDFNIASIFNKEPQEMVLTMFNQSVEEDYIRFNEMYQRFLRNKDSMTDYKNGCEQVSAGIMHYDFDLDDLKRSTPIRFGPGRHRASNQMDFLKAFDQTYFSEAKQYYIPELLEIYRSEIYPKTILRDVFFEEGSIQHEIERKTFELVDSIKEEMKIFNNCFFDIKKAESQAASIVTKEEAEFALSVQEEIAKLNTGEISSSLLLDKFLESVRGLSGWEEFFEDFSTKYGFIKTLGDQYYFVDSPILQALRISNYLKESEISSKYSFGYSSYKALVSRLELNGLQTFRGVSDAKAFFLNNLEKNFGLLDYREKEIFSLVRMNTYQAMIQKIDFDLTKEEAFVQFNEAVKRSNDFAQFYSLQDWEREILNVYPKNCPSCGFASGDNYRGPLGFLASTGQAGAYADYNFVWSPLDSFFTPLGAYSLGLDAKTRGVLPLANTFVVARGSSSTSSSIEERGRGAQVLSLSELFSREDPWSSLSRMTYTALEVRWDAVLDFGGGTLETVVKVIKHDMKIMNYLKAFSEEMSQSYNFVEYDFSMIREPFLPHELVSDHLWTSYESGMNEFHRSTYQLYK